MILKFRHGLAMQTELVDEDGIVVFEISTVWKRTAVAYWTTALTGVRSKTTIGTIDWHDSEPDAITYRGMKQNAEDYLFRYGGPGMRGFATASGRSYVWSPMGKAWQLDILGACVPVARSHNRSFGIFGDRSHPPYIEVDDATAAVDLQEIILTFVYMKHRVQQVLEDCISAASPPEESAFDFRHRPSPHRHHLSISSFTSRHHFA